MEIDAYCEEDCLPKENKWVPSLEKQTTKLPFCIFTSHELLHR